MEKDNNDFHDAKFMLVVCSAFINYVEGKAASERGAHQRGLTP